MEPAAAARAPAEPGRCAALVRRTVATLRTCRAGAPGRCAHPTCPLGERAELACQADGLTRRTCRAGLPARRARPASHAYRASRRARPAREPGTSVSFGANARRQAEEAAAASRIETEAQASRNERLTLVEADGKRALGEAEAAGEAARLAAYRDLPEGVLTGLALKELAGNLPRIDSLVVTPDLLTPLLTKLGVRS
ncbi:hypothetical protein [Amycolatopsis sp. NPDC051061]|uniref:hypothetical protein n=1 Tax=Amycolatopsis sp. NPDC051061 TaxID=3155042 RepID=UPI00343C278C